MPPARAPATRPVGSGRATFRWTDPDAGEGQIVAAARLVHALRGDPGAYR